MTGLAKKFGGAAALTFLVGLSSLPSAVAGREAEELVVFAPEAEAALVCETDASFVMPTTGLVFTLPASDANDVDASCEPAGPPPPERPPAPSLLGMIALPLASPANSMHKWEAARSVSVSDRPGPWDELLAQANSVTGGRPIEMVNRWVNWHVRYENDARGDQWAGAVETLSRGYGDCEDFALAKMALLEQLGLPADDMFLVLLRDHRQDDHAVLAVRNEGSFFVLDNRTDAVLPAERIDDYVPIVSYTGSFAWTYGRAGP